MDGGDSRLLYESTSNVSLTLVTEIAATTETMVRSFCSIKECSVNMTYVHNEWGQWGQ